MLSKLERHLKRGKTWEPISIVKLASWLGPGPADVEAICALCRGGQVEMADSRSRLRPAPAEPIGRDPAAELPHQAHDPALQPTS